MDRNSAPIVIECDKLPKDFTNESGMHRIQRVPPTERRGRVHTSTVSVAIVNEATNSFMGLLEKDIVRRWHSGTGAGGQHRNKTQNCLELTHVATGISVSANGRSRKDNERRAFELLTKEVNSFYQKETDSIVCEDRRSQAGSRSRSGERIRTWKFQTGQVTDHRSGKTCRIPDILKNGVSSLWGRKSNDETA